MVLLHMLRREKRPLMVAHVDHGIRSDSHEDEIFVKELAEVYGLEYLATRLELGPAASEDTARQARYTWLDGLKVKGQAGVIATAHHQDDVIETILINLSRGTGWRGVCSLRETPQRYRPMLGMSKAEIVAYAIEHNLEWREDSTNDSTRYLRNRIRHHVIPRLTTVQRRTFIALYTTQLQLREKIDNECAEVTQRFLSAEAIARYPLIMMPETAAREVLRNWLGESLETGRLNDLLLFSKTARAGAKWSLDGARFVGASKQQLIVLSYRD